MELFHRRHSAGIFRKRKLRTAGNFSRAMNEIPVLKLNDRWILSKRTGKNTMDPFRPYAWMVEKERTAAGKIEDTAIIFLTNRECPFHCLMCDLWKNTTDVKVPVGAIPEQIEFVLNQLRDVKHLKLYNSGSFFDENAIPEQDYERIADLVSGFETVIVESHPLFITDKTIRFRNMLKPRLEVAMGLETIHPGVLEKLNKHMDPDDFRNAVQFLSQHNILCRAFILLRPPFLTESEGIQWAENAIDFAFSVGVECCTVIPVRAGNGAMEYLQNTGYFTPPHISSLETVLEYGIALKKGRVFADTWDLKLFSTCEQCLEKRTDRINEMNLNQKIVSRISCECSDMASSVLIAEISRS